MFCTGLVAAASKTPVSAASSVCSEQGSEAAVVTAVDLNLELRLADGRLLRLVGLEPASPTPGDPDLAETGRQWLANHIVGRQVMISLAVDRPDRWGRFPAFVFGPDQVGSLTVVALAAGLGRYQPEPGAHACRDALIAAEGKARTSRLGLWRDSYYAVLAADDRTAFAEHSATMVVAEARLTAVESGPYRTKLRFATRDRDSRDVLAASILPHSMKLFEEGGMKLRSLIGQTVRLRGLLDLRFGPQIELTSPDALEPLPSQEPVVTPLPANDG